ncbi:MAG: serine/threonine protein kinase [Pirellula sp.]|jgi:serine/threonine protein kinase
MSDASLDDTTKEARRTDENSPPFGSDSFEFVGNQRDDVDVCRKVLESIRYRREDQSEESAPEHNLDVVPRFDRIRFIGAGGFGVVFSAFDRTLEINVAIKFLRPSRVSSVARKRFFEEAKITAGLTHPNIVRMYDSGVLQDIPFISSAYLDGGSLADLILKTPGGMPASDVAEVGYQVAEAVAFAHSKATFHRDLKPSNILIQKGSNESFRIQAALTDFGLAKRWDKEVDNGFTLEGEVPGTIRYMSPEQAKGDLDEFSIQSEVFSIGIILYQLATGVVPFDGSKNSEVKNQIVNQRPKNPKALIASIPKDLESIILKCLEKEPCHRYDSVAELAKDLKRFLNREPVLASRPSQWRQAIWYAKTHPLTSTLVVSTFVILLMSASLIGYAFWNQRIATAKEFQTKVDYVFLFGSLIDDVVAGKKDQQIALLDALSSFKNSLVADLATDPDNSQLQHLLSVIYHYETIVYQRNNSFLKSVESRIESVAILKGLRFRFPDNSKYRFQYIYGVVMLYLAIESAGLDIPEQFMQLQRKLGVTLHGELLESIWPEIDMFKLEFPGDKTQINACIQFKNDLAHLCFEKEPEKQCRIKDEVIAESILLADQNPQNPEFIKPALLAVQQRLLKCLTLGDYEKAVLHANRANELYDRYMRRSFDVLWVKNYYLEMKTQHAYCLLKTKQVGILERICIECIPLCGELIQIPEYRVVCSTCNLKLQTMLLLCEEAAGDNIGRENRIKQILFTLQSPETPTTSLIHLGDWIQEIDAPKEISVTLQEQLTLRNGSKLQ